MDFPDQTTMQRAILDPSMDCPNGLEDGRGAPAGRRFDVYRNNVAVGLTKALETAFPVLRKLVGAENFRVLAGAFLRTHPPRSPLMMFYGEAMPDFLASFGPTATTRYLPDVARLELAIRESYHAKDDAPIDPASVAALPPEKLLKATLTLAAPVRLLRSPWPIYSIWTYNTHPGVPKPAMAAEDVAVVRPDFDPVPLLLPSGAGELVVALQQGRTIGAACEELAVSAPEADPGALIGLLLAHGAVAGIEIPT